MSGLTLTEAPQSPARPQEPTLPRLARGVLKRLRLVYTRLRHPRATFGPRTDIRPRFTLRQSPGATVTIGQACILDNDMTIECTGALHIGARTIFGHHCTLAAHDSVEIGEDCLIAEMVSIRDHDHRFDRLDLPVRCQGMVSSPIRIGRNVWIGGKATITRGVTIGDNVVIGANAVVTNDIPPNSIAAGIPARILKLREA